jgi:HSP20 family protein
VLPFFTTKIKTMDLFKWIKNLKPKFPNLLEKFWGKKIDDHATGDEVISTVPQINIKDTGKQYEVTVAAPGFDKKDIKLEVKDNCLIISSEKQYETEENEGLWMRKEYGYASFQRMFELPEDTDGNNIDASLKDGILKIRLAKRKGKEVTKKFIDVK